MDIVNVIALFGAMSLSVERVVEIFKNILPPLAKSNPDEIKERYRKVTLHIFAACIGSVIANLAQDQIQPLLSDMFRTPGEIGMLGCILIGLLSSGGSGFWNQSLSIVEEIKKAKKLQTQELFKSLKVH